MYVWKSPHDFPGTHKYLALVCVGTFVLFIPISSVLYLYDTATVTITGSFYWCYLRNDSFHHQLRITNPVMVCHLALLLYVNVPPYSGESYIAICRSGLGYAHGISESERVHDQWHSIKI